MTLIPWLKRKKKTVPSQLPPERRYKSSSATCEHLRSNRKTRVRRRRGGEKRKRWLELGPRRTHSWKMGLDLA
jgi:hypothetical protein